MSRILVTGNPNYEGLCKGIYEAYNHNRVEFIGRWNGWDLGDFKKVADHAKDFDVFVNSQYGPDNEQVDILNAVYCTCPSCGYPAVLYTCALSRLTPSIV